MEGRQLISSGSPWELVVDALLAAEWKVEIEVEAICDVHRMPG